VIITIFVISFPKIIAFYISLPYRKVKMTPSLS